MRGCGMPTCQSRLGLFAHRLERGFSYSPPRLRSRLADNKTEARSENQT
jgi:hypothetical protein